ncbi:hypothetical protein KW456_04695 [Vibrio fluvialis]|nr:hypothetical protein [Vibrio fluvialis]
MNILSLVPENEESALNAYIDKGIVRIKSNREFCGLTINSFVDWMFEQDLPRRMVVGLVREVMATQFDPQMSSHKLIPLESFQDNFGDLLEKFIEENKVKIKDGYAAEKKQQFENDLITQFEQIQLSNY